MKLIKSMIIIGGFGFAAYLLGGLKAGGFFGCLVVFLFLKPNKRGKFRKIILN